MKCPAKPPIRLTGAVLLIVAIILSLPAFAAIVDAYSWFFTDHTLTGTEYTFERVLMVAFCGLPLGILVVALIEATA